MQAVAVSEVASEQFSMHRGEGISFARLLRGQPGHPANFEWSIVDIEGVYRTPRHRHDFDQYQLVLSGEHELSPGRVIRKGNVVCLPEATFYGPMQGRGARVLHLQVGGPSGTGFLAYDEIGEGYRRLSGSGEFRDGVYSHVDAEGREHRQDGYEAIAQAMRGRPVRYAERRYEDAIVLDTEAFGWLSVTGAEGVWEKHLITLHERSTQLWMVRLDAAARHTLPARPATTLCFVRDGAIRVGERECGPQTALAFGADDERVVEAREDSELFLVGLPLF